jgi:outer membrane protein assembly factor BamB
MKAAVAASVVLLVALGGPIAAHDWPQFLGPERNGVYRDALAASWPAGGPRRVWQRQVGAGFAAPVVVGNVLVLFHRVANEEVVEAMDTKTGTTRWRHAYATKYEDDFGFDEGPRAAPVVADGRVFTFGAEGRLSAVDLVTGRMIWSDDTKRFGVRKGFFGAAGSPLVENGRVIANVGGVSAGKDAGVVAFKADTGDVLWTATRYEASYSSPVGATLDGARVAVFLTRQGLIGLDPATGAVKFERTWRSRSASSVNAATPLVVGDSIFVSASYETGAAVFQVKGRALSPLWASDEAMSNHYATSVYFNGVLYGFHGRQEFNPSLRAVDFKTGAVKWSIDRFHAGTVTLAGDRLLILRETGELVIAPATPDGYRPTAQAQILPPTVRSYPAVADGFLYARNNDTHRDVLACFDLRP